MTQPTIKGVAEIVINVHDIAAMRRFYENILGFRFHSQFPDDAPTIVFLKIADLASPLGRGGHPQLFALIDPQRHIPARDAYAGLDQKRSTLNHLAFEIEEAAYILEMERLEAAGLTVRTVDFPHMQARGLFFHDPEGNLIELICHRGDS